MAHRSRLFLGALALALLLPACSSDDGGGGEEDAGPEVVSFTDAGEFDLPVTGGVEHVLVEEGDPGTELRLVDADGAFVTTLYAPNGDPAESGTVDDEGLLMFGRVLPGEGYRVVSGTGDELLVSEPVTVLDRYTSPDTALFEGQELVEGVNYIEMRDGVTLAAMVRFPSLPRDDVPADGPYPTVIDMSGYDPANPFNMPGEVTLADALGYATVGVNLRGTGCSGGSLSFFEGSQVADGYDVIETIAAQDWVANHAVGMIGLSYPGITQLFMASTAPPSLAAITPQSVISEAYAGIGYPGGIFNNGFAAEWSGQVSDDATAFGPDYVNQQVDEGDEQCEANQGLRSQNLDLVRALEAQPYYEEDRYGAISPANLVDRIEVPVFMTGQWQDEQTGGYFPTMLDRFAGTDQLHVTLTNGAHADGLTPPIAARWTEFLDFYVARRIPEIPALVRAVAPATLADIFGEGAPFGPDRFADAASYDEALAEYEAEDPIRVVFENGTATANPGGPGGTFEASFSGWPIPEAEATTWYLEPDGSLGTEVPTVADGEDGSVVEYAQDPDQDQDRTLDDAGVDDAFLAQPPFEWPSPQQGEVASWATDGLEEDLVVIGSARTDVWLESSAPDTDLEVTLTEVTPDGDEVYVQSGWLRASHRALDAEASTPLRPVALHTEDAAEPLPEGEFVMASVEIFPFAHAFRTGSQLRLTVDSPGGNRARWAFDSIETAGESNLIGTSSDFASALTLSVVSGVDVPAERPGCGALRAQPCRTYEPVENVPAG